MLTLDTEKFYDSVSDFYDDMTSFGKRINTERPIFKNWLDRYGFKNVLDAACGSGLHTIILTLLGVSTTGTDISMTMLKNARINARQLGTNPVFVRAPLEDLSIIFKRKFDVIFCLGNTIPHILSQDNLHTIFKGFLKLLTKQGKLIIQLLNYSKILAEKERIVSISKNKNQVYVRFYDFLDTFIRFNVLQINWKNQQPQYYMKSTHLYPYIYSELQTLLNKADFSVTNNFGNMELTSFDENESQNVVMICEKA